MIAIFQEMFETFMEVFMDDFSIFEDSFNSCLANLEQMLIQCKQAHLVLNWEKCHFMVTKGIVLGHKVSSVGLEVDKEKIDVIAKLPPPTNVKAVRIFDFNEECIKAFETLKEKFTNVSIMVSPDWSQPFKLMCNASNFAVGAVLEQQEGKHFRLVYFSSKTLNNAQQNYTVTEKELLAVKNKKRAESVVADHLPRLENSNLEELRVEDIDDNFPDETLMNVSSNNEDEILCCNPDLKITGEKGFLQIHELDELRLQAYENSKLYKALTKAYHDRKLRIQKEFKAKGKVILYNSKYKFKDPKLKSKWYGPFVVKHGFPSGYVELYDKHRGSFIVNGHRVKLYHHEEQLNEPSSCSKHMTGDRSRLMNFVKKFIGTVRFGNDHFGAIMGYGDYVIGDSVISRACYVEELGHNLFYVEQLYEPASLVRDDSQGDACPTDSGLIADQDRATIAKSSTLPHDSAPRVTSPAAEEGNMQQTLNELTDFCTCNAPLRKEDVKS
nr:reverse transcriptase domain-containing protein [Tanacetum cinerariifolium]